MCRVTTEALVGLNDSHITWLSKTVGVHQNMAKHFIKMQNAAAKDGVELSIASGFRSFDRQMSIWTRKLTGVLPVKDHENNNVDLTTLTDIDKVKAILRYSALPGTSRHHWGTDIDVYSPSQLSNDKSLQLEYWEYAKGGPFEKLTHWLTQNAYKYNFFFPYQKFQGGVAAEPWHLSYAPLANEHHQALMSGILMPILAKSNMPLYDEIARNISMIFSKYVNNISEFTNG